MLASKEHQGLHCSFYTSSLLIFSIACQPLCISLFNSFQTSGFFLHYICPASRFCMVPFIVWCSKHWFTRSVASVFRTSPYHLNLFHCSISLCGVKFRDMSERDDTKTSLFCLSLNFKLFWLFSAQCSGVIYIVDDFIYYYNFYGVHLV